MTFFKSWKAFFLRIACLGVVIYGLTLLALYFTQERLIFPGMRAAAAGQFHFTVPFEEKFLTAETELTAFCFIQWMRRA
jgi:hypothetical protein